MVDNMTKLNYITKKNPLPRIRSFITTLFKLFAYLFLPQLSGEIMILAVFP